jgi:hypothetical protein
MIDSIPDHSLESPRDGRVEHVSGGGLADPVSVNEQWLGEDD